MSSREKLLRVGLTLLGIGFVATAGGSVWTILSPIGGGVNFLAVVIYQGGMLLGLVGLVISIVGLFYRERD